jgi:hypothetical protein
LAKNIETYVVLPYAFNVKNVMDLFSDIKEIDCEDNVKFASFGICNISGISRDFVWAGGVQQIPFRTEDRENGDLGVVAP